MAKRFAIVFADDRVPTRLVQEYTVTAPFEPSGATEPIVAASPHVDLAAVGRRGKLASRINRRRETVGGPRPARFCQEQTHVLTAVSARSAGATPSSGPSASGFALRGCLIRS